MADRLVVKEILHLTTRYLQDHNISNPRLEAELLLGDVLGLERINLYVQFDRPLTPEEKDAMRDRIRRRVRGEPLPYITGEKEFLSLPFSVDKRVLIPRPETEHLVERALEIFSKREELMLVDVGTGSGVIAISLAVNLPRAKVLAIDKNEDVLKVAEGNARRHEVQDRIEFLAGDLLQPVKERKGQIDGILSNPPYVDRNIWGELPPEVRAQPRQALVAGQNGLEYYEPLLRQAGELLKKGGYAGVEIGFDQAHEVLAIFRKEGFRELEVIKDYAGHSRIVFGCL